MAQIGGLYVYGGIVRPHQAASHDCGPSIRRLVRAEKSHLVIVAKTLGLFLITAIAEIVGCYLPYLWLRKDGSPWLLLPAAVCLALFAWLLTLHPTASGRVYAAYGGVYVAVALLWLWWVDGEVPTGWDLAGVAVILVGMGIIVWGGWQT